MFGYYTDDKMQRLLSLKNWIHNVHPPDPEFLVVSPETDNMWNIAGLLPNHYLSSALIVPITIPTSLT